MEMPTAVPAEDPQDTITLQVGARVKAQYLASDPSVRPTKREVRGGYGPGKWYEGSIQAVNDDGTYTIHYDDGETEMNVLPAYTVALAGDADAGALPLLAPTASASSNGSNHAASSGSDGLPQAGGRATRRSSMSVRSMPAESEQSTPAETEQPTRDNGSDAAKRVAALEDKLAASQQAEAQLRAQLGSVMNQAAALHEAFNKATDLSSLPDGLASAVSALGLRARRFMQGEGEGPYEDHPILDSSVANEELAQTVQSGSSLASSSNTCLTSDVALAATDHVPSGTATHAGASSNALSIGGSAEESPSAKLQVDQVCVGARVRVWFTRLMLRMRDATPHFESGVIESVREPELARRGGGLTVRFRIYYDDGASHEHLLDEDYIELIESANANQVDQAQAPVRSKRKAAAQAAEALDTPSSRKAKR